MRLKLNHDLSFTFESETFFWPTGKEVNYSHRTRSDGTDVYELSSGRVTVTLIYDYDEPFDHDILT